MTGKKAANHSQILSKHQVHCFVNSRIALLSLTWQSLILQYFFCSEVLLREKIYPINSLACTNQTINMTMGQHPPHTILLSMDGLTYGQQSHFPSLLDDRMGRFPSLTTANQRQNDLKWN